MVSTINFERPEPTPATAALGGVTPAPSRSLYLRHLDLTDCTRLMDEGLHVIVRNAPHLQQLYLRRCVLKSNTEIGDGSFSIVFHVKSLCGRPKTTKKQWVVGDSFLYMMTLTT